MCKFNLKNRLKEIYSKFPEAEKAPVIGITTNHEGMDATLREKYYEQVVKAGGVPNTWKSEEPWGRDWWGGGLGGGWGGRGGGRVGRLACGGG